MAEPDPFREEVGKRTRKKTSVPSRYIGNEYISPHHKPQRGEGEKEFGLGKFF